MMTGPASFTDSVRRTGTAVLLADTYESAGVSRAPYVDAVEDMFGLGASPDLTFAVALALLLARTLAVREGVSVARVLSDALDMTGVQDG